MGKTATINVRVDESDKQSAEQVLKQLGMPMSTLVTLLLKQISLTKSIPLIFHYQSTFVSECRRNDFR